MIVPIGSKTIIYKPTEASWVCVGKVFARYGLCPKAKPWDI